MTTPRPGPARRMRLALDPVRRDAGLGTLEYIGMVLLAVVLTVAVILAMNTANLPVSLQNALCELTSAFGGGGGCDASTTADDERDREPPQECVAGSDGSSWEGSVAVGVQVEGGETWLVERLGDGTYRMTRSEMAGVGAEIGWGFDVSATVDDRDYGAAVTAGGEAVLRSTEGEVYYASSEDEAHAILDAKGTDDTKDAWFGDDGWMRDGWDWMAGASDYENREPDETWIEGGVDASARVFVLAIYENAGAEAKLGTYNGTVERKDGTSTDRYTAFIDTQAYAEMWTATQEDGYQIADAVWGEQLTIEVVRDADGNATAVRQINRSVARADAERQDRLEVPRYTETVVEVPLETDADRRVAGSMLQSLGMDGVAGVTDVLSPLDLPGNVIDFGDNNAAFVELAQDRGYQSSQTYELSTSTNGGTVDAKWFLEVGLSGSQTSLQRTTVDAKYWDGTGMTSWDGCTGGMGGGTRGTSGGGGSW